MEQNPYLLDKGLNGTLAPKVAVPTTERANRRVRAQCASRAGAYSTPASFLDQIKESPQQKSKDADRRKSCVCYRAVPEVDREANIAGPQ
jgi:hypothetical protein